MNKFSKRFFKIIFTTFLFISFFIGCKSSINETTQPVDNFKIDGSWQTSNFSPDYPFTFLLANLRTNGPEVKGNITSDCFGLFQATDIPFRIIEGVYVGTDISLTFQMETAGIIGHFYGNIKNSSTASNGRVIVGHMFFEYAGTLTQKYPMHLVKQSITYLPKIKTE